jgi:hypothetical protein
MDSVRATWQLRGVRSSLVFAAAASLTLCACDESEIRISGRILNADGTPAEGRPVSMWALSLDPDEGNLHSYTRTDTLGHYELTGHVRPSFSDERVVVDVRSQADISITDLEFSVPTDNRDVRVSDLHIWNRSFMVESRPDGGARVTWSPAPADLGPVELLVYQANPGEQGRITWDVPSLTGTSFDVPAEVMEDRLATVQLMAGDRDVAFGCDKPLCVMAYTGVGSVVGGTLEPVSRGATCTAETDEGSEVALLGNAGTPCALTDGLVDYPSASRWSCDSQRCAPLRSVTIDLAAAVSVHSIAVHALYSEGDGAVTVETSVDGQTFTPAQSIEPRQDGAYALLRLAAPVTARYIRVVAPERIDGLDELSVF